MKSKFGIAIVILVLSVIGITAVLFIGKSGSAKKNVVPTPRPKLAIPANTVPLEERPYITLAPTAAREVVLTVSDLKKSAQQMDFELQYSAGDKEEAAIGSLDLKKVTLPYSKTILLGSQSGGGKITYHEHVTGGSLVLTFYDENYKLMNDWSYQDNRKAQSIFTSLDGKFALDTAKLLKNSPFVIVYQNPGLPAPVQKTVLAGPYSISATSTLPNGKASITMRIPENKPSVSVLGWDGKTWKTYKATVNDKQVTATVDLLQTYLAVGE